MKARKARKVVNRYAQRYSKVSESDGYVLGGLRSVATGIGNGCHL
ncbi:MAG: hypothetical protein WCV67_12965 [Victivallaceae bacterium]